MFGFTGTGKPIQPWWVYDPHFDYGEVFATFNGLSLQAVEHGLEVHTLSESGQISTGITTEAVWQEMLRLTGAKAHWHNSNDIGLPGSLARIFSPFDNSQINQRWGIWAQGVFQIQTLRTLGIAVHLLTTDQEMFQQVNAQLVRMLHRPPQEGQVYTLHQPSPDKPIQTRSLGVVKVPLIRDNYTEETLQAYDKIVRDLRRTDPTGRLSIITGSPGTGKTYLLRALVTEVDAEFVLVPAKLIQRLGDPDVVTCFMDRPETLTPRPLVFILEDADAILSKRLDANMDGIMSALNLGDGMIGDMLDARLVATSNVLTGEVDEALLRPGRLNVRVDVGPLPPEQAQRVLTRLLADQGPPNVEITTPRSLAEVYAMAREMGWEAPILGQRTQTVRPRVRGISPYVFDSTSAQPPSKKQRKVRS